MGAPHTKPIWRARAVKLGLLLFWLALGEGFASYMLSAHLPSWDKARLGLAGAGGGTYRNAVGQSYLNYVPAPGFSDEHGSQHNDHGYRGVPVPLDKQPGTLRILCLGGSTTYGWAVDEADSTYPAHLQRVLAAEPPAGYDEVEVINAGIPWGTSAELLTHYHFKYHYYRPDVVVLHTGLNDAQAFDMETYQPDYAHWRQQMQRPLVLPRSVRWLARSRLVGLVLVPTLFGPRPEVPSFNRRPSVPAIDWYEDGRFDRDEPQRVPEEEIAFVHNVRSLVHEIQRDGAAVLLMPVEFRSVGESEAELTELVARSSNSLRYTRRNAELLRGIANDLGAVFVPFPQSALEPGDWVELIHLGPEGSLTKARHVAAYVSPALDDGG